MERFSFLQILKLKVSTVKDQEIRYEYPTQNFLALKFGDGDGPNLSRVKKSRC